MNNLRFNLLRIALILITIGITMIYSASAMYALNRYNDSAFFLKRQIFFVLLGVLISFIVLMYDYKYLAPISKKILMVALLLLVLVLIPGIGKEAGGARRWFRFGYFSFQPSEFANLATIIYLADYIKRKERYLRNFFRGVLPAVLVLGMVSGLIVLQPDFGSAVSLVLLGFILLFIAGVRIKHIFYLILAGLPFLYILVMQAGYRKLRILAFLNPWQDPQGSGFQIIQSQVALGSGGLWGVGLGHSRQKLFYLPAAHTDFIFSIIGEELGLMGTLGVLFLFFLFIQQALKIVKNTYDKFGYFLGLGIIIFFSLRILINMGVSVGLFPAKGLPLPFISYGGSSLIFDMINTALLLNISRYTQEQWRAREITR